MEKETELKTMKTFSEKLSLLMKQRQINQVELSMALGLNRSTVNKWIAQKAFPRLSIIDKICEYFEVERSMLLDGRVSLSIKNIEYIEFVYHILTDEGKEKLDQYIDDLLANHKNIDSNELAKALLIENLTPEAKEKRAKLAKELRILKHAEKAAQRKGR